MLNSVLTSIALHIFSVIQPTEGTFKQIDSLMAISFWVEADWRKKRHWIAWDYLCYPYILRGGNLNEGDRKFL